LTSGLGGFPIGDLNWFPTKKTEWLKQRDAEYYKINEALNNGELVTTVQNQEKLPSQFQLSQNYPNPFNPITIINYFLPTDEKVVIKIYDILGKEIAELVNEFKTAGKYSVEFNGSSLASGIYFYRIEAGKFTQTKKLVFTK